MGLLQQHWMKQVASLHRGTAKGQENPKFGSFFSPELRESFSVLFCPVCKLGLKPAGLLGTLCGDTRDLWPQASAVGQRLCCKSLIFKHSVVNKET